MCTQMGPSPMSNGWAPWLAGLCSLIAACAPSSPRVDVGRAASVEEIRARDIDVLPDGKGLPSGEDDAAAGRLVFLAKCSRCHGPVGEGSAHYPQLVGGAGTLGTSHPILTVGSYWPYATTLWDYVHRAMPYPQPGSLTARDTYGVTAYILFLNHVIGEHDVMNAMTLPQVKMPNQAGFVMGAAGVDSIPPHLRRNPF